MFYKPRTMILFQLPFLIAFRVCLPGKEISRKRFRGMTDGDLTDRCWTYWEGRMDMDMDKDKISNGHSSGRYILKLLCWDGALNFSLGKMKEIKIS